MIPLCNLLHWFEVLNTKIPLCYIPASCWLLAASSVEARSCLFYMKLIKLRPKAATKEISDAHIRHQRKLLASGYWQR